MIFFLLDRSRSPDCEHAECWAIGIAIAIFKFCIYHVFRVKKKMSLFAFLRILALIAIAPNLAQIILRTLRRAGRFTFWNFYLGQVRRHFEFFFLIQSHSNESYFFVPVEHQPVKSHQTLYTWTSSLNKTFARDVFCLKVIVQGQGHFKVAKVWRSLVA